MNVFVPTDTFNFVDFENEVTEKLKATRELDFTKSQRNLFFLQCNHLISNETSGYQVINVFVKSGIENLLTKNVDFENEIPKKN